MIKTQSQKVNIDFEKNRYVSIPQVLEGRILDFFYAYITLFADRFEIIANDLPQYYNEYEHGWRSRKDPVAPHSFSKYGDMLADTLLLLMRENIEDKIGLKLIPTYGFFRLYKKGNDLELHKDRNSCEISLSLCIGYEGEQWPLYINGMPIYQERGDVVVYRGCEALHWRKPFIGKHHAQIFLHYVDKNGPYGKKYTYDSRPFIGLPTITGTTGVYQGTRYENTKSES